MTIDKKSGTGFYWIIGITPITATAIYFGFRLFGIAIGLRGMLLMIALLLIIKIALWFVLRFFFLKLRDDEYH